MTATDAVPLSSLLTVVIATRDRCDQLDASLRRLLGGVDPVDRPAVVVVDNASSDDTVAHTRERHPEVTVVGLDRNEGAAARNIGAATAATEVVAFNDDDSWWAPGSLRRVAELFAGYPKLGLVAARVLVGADDRLDPVSEMMGRSPLRPSPGSDGAPGRPVLGFLACAAAVRRSAFVDVGGFSRTLFFMGEETALAVDLAAAGWDLRYRDDLVVHHRPQSAGRTPTERRIQQQRNALLTMWMRRPARRALEATVRLARDARTDPVARGALAAALRAAPATWRERRVVPPAVEDDLRVLERDQDMPTPPPASHAPADAARRTDAHAH